MEYEIFLRKVGYKLKVNDFHNPVVKMVLNLDSL